MRINASIVVVVVVVAAVMMERKGKGVEIYGREVRYLCGRAGQNPVTDCALHQNQPLGSRPCWPDLVAKSASF